MLVDLFFFYKKFPGQEVLMPEATNKGKESNLHRSVQVGGSSTGSLFVVAAAAAAGAVMLHFD